MVKVKIISGPKKGQVNLSEMKPKDLIMLAREGWRWKVDWKTISSEEELYEWVKYDLICKVSSSLLGGREVVFQIPGKADQKWFGDFSLELAEKIEDAIVNSGRNVTLLEDSEDRLVILGDSLTQ